MNALWNQKDLERPANNIWIASRKEIDYRRFLSALGIVVKDLDSQSTLHMEAAILSRLIYRMKRKLRHDKGVKNMEKVNRALLNYAEVDLLKEYRDLKNYVEIDGLAVNLPTKQMLEYVLVRTQGFAKLMCRIENVAKCSAEFFKARINMGHVWSVSVIAYAVVSRIWYLSRYLVKRCCAWYNSVFEYVNKFSVVGPKWLPSNYDLPSNLKTWLDLPWIDQVTDSVPLKDDGKQTIFSLIKVQIDDPSDLNIESMKKVESLFGNFDDSINNFEECSKEVERILPGGSQSSEIKKEVLFIADDDIGMPIDRRSFITDFCPEVIGIPDEIESKENPKENYGEKVEIELLSEENKKEKSCLPSAEDIVLPPSVSAKTEPKRKRKIAKKLKKSLNPVEINSADAKTEENLKNSGELKADEERESAFKKRKLEVPEAEEKPVKIDIDLSDLEEKQKHSTPLDIKSRDDLFAFLNKNSHPGLDRLQWNMLNNSVKKIVTELEKCPPTDKKKEKKLLQKISCQIRNWIE